MTEPVVVTTKTGPTAETILSLSAYVCMLVYVLYLCMTGSNKRPGGPRFDIPLQQDDSAPTAATPPKHRSPDSGHSAPAPAPTSDSSAPHFQPAASNPAVPPSTNDTASDENSTTAENVDAAKNLETLKSLGLDPANSKWSNYKPQIPTESEKKKAKPGLLPSRHVSANKKSVRFVDDKPEYRTFYLGSRLEEQFLDEDERKKATMRDPHIPADEYDEQTQAARGKGFHGEARCALALSRLKELGIGEEMYDLMVECERITEVVVLNAGAGRNSEGDDDMLIPHFGRVPTKVVRICEKIIENGWIDFGALAPAMWHTHRRNKKHLICYHPLYPMSEIIQPPTEEDASAYSKTSKWAIAEDRQQTLLLGYFVLALRGCGQRAWTSSHSHGPDVHVGGKDYDPSIGILGAMVEEAIDQKGQQILVWLHWLGRRWMMKRVFSPRSADLLEGSLRISIRQLPSDYRDSFTQLRDPNIPSFRLDVTLFLPEVLQRSEEWRQHMENKIPEKEKGSLDDLMGKKWTEHDVLISVLETVLNDAQCHIESVLQTFGKLSTIDYGECRVPRVRLKRIFFRSGLLQVPPNSKRQGHSSVGPPGQLANCRFERPPRVHSMSVDEILGIKLAQLSRSGHIEPIIRSLSSLMRRIRPDKIEFCNLKEDHMIQWSNQVEDSEDPHNHHVYSVTAMLLFMMGQIVSSETMRHNKDAFPWHIDKIHQFLNETSTEPFPIESYGSFKAGPNDKIPEIQRRVWLDTGGVMPLINNRFPWHRCLPNVKLFRIPFHPRIKNPDGRMLPSTGELLLDPKHGMLHGMMLPDRKNRPMYVIVVDGMTTHKDPLSFEKGKGLLHDQLRCYLPAALSYFVENPEQGISDVHEKFRRVHDALKSQVRMMKVADCQTEVLESITTEIDFDYVDPGPDPQRRRELDAQMKEEYKNYLLTKHFAEGQPGYTGNPDPETKHEQAPAGRSENSALAALEHKLDLIVQGVRKDFPQAWSVARHAATAKGTAAVLPWSDQIKSQVEALIPDRIKHLIEEMNKGIANGVEENPILGAGEFPKEVDKIFNNKLGDAQKALEDVHERLSHVESMLGFAEDSCRDYFLDGWLELYVKLVDMNVQEIESRGTECLMQVLQSTRKTAEKDGRERLNASLGPQDRPENNATTHKRLESVLDRLENKYGSLYKSLVYLAKFKDQMHFVPRYLGLIDELGAKAVSDWGRIGRIDERLKRIQELSRTDVDTVGKEERWYTEGVRARAEMYDAGSRDLTKALVDVTNEARKANPDASNIEFFSIFGWRFASFRADLLADTETHREEVDKQAGERIKWLLGGEQ